MKKEKIEKFGYIPVSTEVKHLIDFLKVKHKKERYEDLVLEMIDIYTDFKNSKLKRVSDN